MVLTAAIRTAALQSPRRALVRPPRLSPRWPQSTRCLSILEHRHLTSDEPGGLVSYDDAQSVQEQHRARLLAWKALPDAQRRDTPSPRPLLISFECAPTFTLGRRQDDLTPAQAAHLQQPLRVRLRSGGDARFLPVVRKTNRGGLTTYHGPGQLVVWPVIDMHSPLYARYGVASYAGHLEATTQRLLATRFGVGASTVRDEPGVWVDADGERPRKIAALGVHHRRYVTALGLALNVDLPVEGGEETNPWARFVPCGLEGKAVTSVAAEAGDKLERAWDAARLAGEWARLFEQGILDESKRSFDGIQR
ncbi:Lipoyltransferase [Purpureocillium lavendulum]|uniref:Lipoyltransferase n=1 Tax=Purpureocillium lavendulum TaxID=1247861 RepID=A0AB34G7P4_9HYPO|nr:Lipoyltransferase [Purpureocillium lavendulum]